MLETLLPLRWASVEKAETLPKTHLKKSKGGGASRVSGRLLDASASQRKEAALAIQQHTKVFSHCGRIYSKKRGIVVVDNNSVGSLKFRAPSKNCTSRGRLPSGNLTHDPAQANETLALRAGSRPRARAPLPQSYQESVGVVESRNTLVSCGSRSRDERQGNKTLDAAELRCRARRNGHYVNASITRVEDYHTSVRPESGLYHQSLCAEEIAKSLQSNVGHEHLGSQHIRTFAVATLNHATNGDNEKLSGNNKNNSESKSKSSSRNQGGKSKLPYSRYAEFRRMQKYSMEAPVIRNASPYMSIDQARHVAEQESKKKWINPEGFRSCCGKVCKSYRMVEGYVVGKDPSEPPICHKFREVDKSRWISTSFK